MVELHLHSPICDKFTFLRLLYERVSSLGFKHMWITCSYVYLISEQLWGK
jgi:hypothetical protein